MDNISNVVQIPEEFFSNSDLRTQLNEERSKRLFTEKQLKHLSQRLKFLEITEEEQLEAIKGKAKTKKKVETEEYCEYKTNGVKKASSSDSIRSYDDYLAIYNCLGENKYALRDQMFWTVGICLGLRVSDLTKIKMKYIINEEGQFRDRLKVIEKKTSKLNDCLITEAVKQSITRYLDSIEWKFKPDDYLFKSQKEGKMTVCHGWRIVSQANEKVGLPIHIGSHTMRKSFANIVAIIDDSTIDMNMLTKVQGLLNHSDQKTTMRYLGVLDDMYDRARTAVSDFVLGKTKVKSLTITTRNSMEEIMERLDSLEHYSSLPLRGTNETNNKRDN